MTVFFRTRLKVDVNDANYYLGSLFYALIILLSDGFPELSMSIARLPVFFKQRDMFFYPAWAYAIPAAIIKIPLSLLEATIWMCLTYYVIGYSPQPGRFFGQRVLLFAMHFMILSMFRFCASLFRTVDASTSACGMAYMFLFSFGGFILPYTSMPPWLKWGFWACPLSYAEIGLALNEFLSPRWNKMTDANTTIGIQTLQRRGARF